MLHADNLTETSLAIDGKWVVARPLPFFGIYGMIMRVKDAYVVLTGKADAVKFYKQ